MYSISCGASAAASSACSMAARAPRPCGCGADMWCASLDSPTPSSSTAFASRLAPGRSSSANAAASPMEIPSRATSKARHGLLAPVAGGGALHGLGKTVLGEAEVGQAIVAALELAQRRGERGLIDARYLAHPGVERHRLEGARGEPGAPLVQRSERGGDTATDAARGGEARERERIHAPVVYVSVARHDPRPCAT